MFAECLSLQSLSLVSVHRVSVFRTCPLCLCHRCLSTVSLSLSPLSCLCSRCLCVRRAGPVRSCRAPVLCPATADGRDGDATVWYRTLGDDDLVPMASEPGSVGPDGAPAAAADVTVRSNFVETWLWTNVTAGYVRGRDGHGRRRSTHPQGQAPTHVPKTDPPDPPDPSRLPR